MEFSFNILFGKFNRIVKFGDELRFNLPIRSVGERQGVFPSTPLGTSIHKIESHGRRSVNCRKVEISTDRVVHYVEASIPFTVLSLRFFLIKGVKHIVNKSCIHKDFTTS